MILFKSVDKLQVQLNLLRKSGKQIGFVPTMGALHAGHLSLIDECKKDNAVTVCSIFVNPTQFNDINDFKKYPVTIEKDIDMLEGRGCDILFLPEIAEIYPAEKHAAHYDLGYLESVLEGKFRPGHFQGVCQVVDRLLTIVAPSKLYLGQKDFQQCMVLRRLVDLRKDITEVIVCPTLREADGLAMSSRNTRLNPVQRDQATALYKSLLYIKQHVMNDPLQSLKSTANQMLSNAGFRVDYIEVADAETLQLVEVWDGRQKIVALGAAFLDDIRLIDNLLIN